MFLKLVATDILRIPARRVSLFLQDQSIFIGWSTASEFTEATPEGDRPGHHRADFSAKHIPLHYSLIQNASTLVAPEYRLPELLPSDACWDMSFDGGHCREYLFTQFGGALFRVLSGQKGRPPVRLEGGRFKSFRSPYFVRGATDISDAPYTTISCFNEAALYFCRKSDGLYSVTQKLLDNVIDGRLVWRGSQYVAVCRHFMSDRPGPHGEAPGRLSNTLFDSDLVLQQGPIGIFPHSVYDYAIDMFQGTVGIVAITADQCLFGFFSNRGQVDWLNLPTPAWPLRSPALLWVEKNKFVLATCTDGEFPGIAICHYELW